MGGEGTVERAWQSHWGGGSSYERSAGRKRVPSVGSGPASQPASSKSAPTSPSSRPLAN